MRTTLNLDDKLVQKAQALTGLKSKTATVNSGLEALVARESARRLSKLGGSEPQLKPVKRRQTSTTHK